jgi:CTP-dependent riboflavin kinase
MGVRLINGNIEAGFHVAAQNLRRVMHLIEERTGLADLVPGTLNVRIGGEYIVIRCAVITPEEYGLNETAKLQRCLVQGHKAIITRPDTHEKIAGYGHGKNHLELMGRVNFRETLHLQDGDPVTIEVEGNNAWWDSGF